MKKILTIEEGNTNCRICSFRCNGCYLAVEEIFGEGCCSKYDFSTLKIEKTIEENKLIDWEQRKFNLYEKLILNNPNQYNFSDLFSTANRAIEEYKNKIK